MREIDEMLGDGPTWGPWSARPSYGASWRGNVAPACSERQR